MFLNQHTSPALRALRTDRTNALEFDHETNAMVLFGAAMDLYFGGDMEAAIALSGQVAGRIDSDRAGRQDHRGVRPGLPRHPRRPRQAVPLGHAECVARQPARLKVSATQALLDAAVAACFGRRPHQ